MHGLQVDREVKVESLPGLTVSIVVVDWRPRPIQVMGCRVVMMGYERAELGGARTGRGLCGKVGPRGRKKVPILRFHCSANVCCLCTVRYQGSPEDLAWHQTQWRCWNERMVHRAAQQPKQAGGLAAGQKSEKVGESVGRRAAGSCAGWEYLPESSPTNESTVVKVLKSHIAKNKSSKKFPPPVWKYREACKCF